MTIFDDLSTTYDSMGVSYDGGVPDMAAWTVEVAYAANPMDPISSMAWTDISQWVRSGETTSGKSHELDQIQAGTAKFTIDNRDGRFSPWSTSGYALHTMHPIRVSAAWGGPYPVWFGYTENAPVKWADAVNCDIELTAVDIFKILAQGTIDSGDYSNQVLADGPPLMYYRLGDNPRSINLADSSGNGHTATVYGVPTLGQDGASVVDADTAAQFDGNWYAFAGATLNGISGDFTIEFWLKLPINVDLTDGFSTLILGTDATSATPDPNWGFTISHDTSFPASIGTLHPFFTGASGPSTYNPGGSPPLNDNQWHHIVLTHVGSQYTTYIDGTVWDTHHITTSITFDSKPVQIGAAYRTDFLNGTTLVPFYQPQRTFTLDELAVYTVGLTAAQVANHYTLARRAFNTEHSGARIGTVLDIAGWASADRAIATGISEIQGATASLASTAPLSYLQQVEVTEAGVFYQGPDGQLVFRGRDYVMTEPVALDSQVTIGGAAGAEPYRLDGSEIGEDDLDIWNAARATRVGGNAQFASDPTSRQRYGPRTWKPAAELLSLTDAEAFDRVTWVVLRYKNPDVRVGSVAVDPRSDPAVLWPKVLGLGLLSRVTFSRPTADGHTFTRDQIIEGVQHSFTPSTWRTVWHLNTADPNRYFRVGISAIGDGSVIGY